MGSYELGDILMQDWEEKNKFHFLVIGVPKIEGSNPRYDLLELTLRPAYQNEKELRGGVWRFSAPLLPDKSYLETPGRFKKVGHVDISSDVQDLSNLVRKNPKLIEYVCVDTEPQFPLTE